MILLKPTKKYINHIKTNMEKIRQLSFATMDLMKSIINGGEILSEKARELLLQTGKELDRCKVYNEPTSEIEYLYDTALWLNEKSNNQIN